MKAFVMTDLEGVAGVVSFADQTSPETRYGEQAKRLLTGEVNACVQGLLESGAKDVAVLDGHGAGGIVFEDIHPEARLIHGRPLSGAWEESLQETDVALFVGQHAMAGTPRGNLNHTQDSKSITSYTLNGRPIGEIAQFALLAGSYGIPVIFLSGDEAACREAEDLIPGITTTAVKKGLGRNSAISMSAQKARALIQAGVAAAMTKHGAAGIAPLRWAGPYVLEKKFFTAEPVERYRALARLDASIRVVDELTVQIRSDDIRSIIFG